MKTEKISPQNRAALAARQQPAFGRALYAWEKPGYTQTIQDAFKALNKKNVSLIVHGASFPANPGENTGFGSPVSNGSKRLLSFLSQLGFNSIQLGPGGLTKGIEPSPYTSTGFSNNTMFVDLVSLANAPEWGGILSKDTANRIVKNNPNNATNRAAYNYIFKEQALALQEAYATFKEKLAKVDELPKTQANAIKSLDAKFKTFQENNKDWLDQDALYEALSEYHGNDYFPNWNKTHHELDKNLFCPRSSEEAKAAETRIAEVKQMMPGTIEQYKFSQFLIAEQIKRTNEFANSKGMKFFADRQVAFADRDIWAYQKAFLPNHYLGVPPDYFSKDGQAWAFAAIDPSKILNDDGSYGPGGQLMYRLFKKMFRENRGGVRIDHVIGLIDPWFYPKDGKPTIVGGGARAFGSPGHKDFGKYAYVNESNINKAVSPDNEEHIHNLKPEQIEKYSRIMQIVEKAAADEGLDRKALIIEDLGTLTAPVREVLKKFGYGGFKVTQFVTPNDPNHAYRGKNLKPNDWAMTGSHDNGSVSLWRDQIEKEGSLKTHAEMLAEDLYHPKSDAEKQTVVDRLVKNPKAFVNAKLAEIFASPAENVQVMFLDLFGIKDAYNKPGTLTDKNWSLRVPDNFKKYYDAQLREGNALNMPKVLLTALQAQGIDKKPEHRILVKKLEGYQETLNKPSFWQRLNPFA